MRSQSALAVTDRAGSSLGIASTRDPAPIASLLLNEHHLVLSIALHEAAIESAAVVLDPVRDAYDLAWWFTRTAVAERIRQVVDRVGMGHRVDVRLWRS